MTVDRQLPIWQLRPHVLSGLSHSLSLTIWKVICPSFLAKKIKNKKTDNVDEDNPDGVWPKPVEKVGIPLATEITRVPKNKRKTADAQTTSTTSSLATVPKALTASAVPTAPTNIAGDQATPYLYNSDPTWGDLDIDLHLPFGFNTTSFDHQTSTDSGFNLEFPTFSPDFSFDTCHTSSTFDIIATNPATSVDASLFVQSQPSAALLFNPSTDCRLSAFNCS